MAALLLRITLGNVQQLGAPAVHLAAVPVFCAEAFGTLLYTLSTFATSTRYSSVGPNSAIARGAVLASVGLFFGPISGASLNPQRALDPMIADWHFTHAWLYVLAPFAGMLAAVAAIMLLRRRPDVKQYQAAQRDPSKGARYIFFDNRAAISAISPII